MCARPTTRAAQSSLGSGARTRRGTSTSPIATDRLAETGLHGPEQLRRQASTILDAAEFIGTSLRYYEDFVAEHRSSSRGPRPSLAMNIVETMMIEWSAGPTEMVKHLAASCASAWAHGRRSPRPCATRWTVCRRSPPAGRRSRPRWRCASPGSPACRWTSSSPASGCLRACAPTAASHPKISSTRKRSSSRYGRNESISDIRYPDMVERSRWHVQVG
jgi:hypothetical protein